MDFFANALLIAIFSYGLAMLVTREDWPFELLFRFKMKLLPPEGRPEDLVPDWTADSDLPFHEYLMKIDALKANRQLWISTWEADPRFLYGFRGTLYTLLDCEYCLGFWVNLLGVCLVYWQSLLDPTKLILLILSQFTSYGLYRIILRFI